MNQVDPLAHSYGSVTPYNFSFNNPIAFVDVNGAKPGPWSQDFAESYMGSDYGNRNTWAKMVAHGQMDQFVGGAGEGWDGYVGRYNLYNGGYGMGSMYFEGQTLLSAKSGEENARNSVTVYGRKPDAGVTYYNPTESRQFIMLENDCDTEGVGGVMHLYNGHLLSVAANSVVLARHR